MATERIADFDLYRQGYSGATVNVYLAGTTTLANIWLNEAKTVAAANPQALSSATFGGELYGKWASPVYIDVPYTLDIDTLDSTGVVRPGISSLVGEDVSFSIATPSGGSEVGTIADYLGRVIDVRDYGDFLRTGDAGVSTATNTATLATAVGIVSGNGGGAVRLYEGTFPFTDFALPEGCFLIGEGSTSTTLESVKAGVVGTFSDNSCGLIGLTLDGVSLAALSVGIEVIGKTGTSMQDVIVKRFETGIHQKGGRYNKWLVDIDNCATGAKLHGDLDGGPGDELFDNYIEGLVSTCTVYGLDYSYEDAGCWHSKAKVGFSGNTGTALRLNGTQFMDFEKCWWENNTTNLLVLDDTDTTVVNDNLTFSVHFHSARMQDGAMTIQDTAQDVIFEEISFSDVDITLTSPDNAVLAKDCREDNLVTISGDATKWHRFRTIDDGSVVGVTTGSAPTKAWSYDLAPGQMVHAVATVLANQTDGVSTAEYYFTVFAKRDGSDLDYDAQTVNFVVGETVTGADSGATALITADADGGATGTLTLRNISGVFQNNELITGSGGGSADVDGVLQPANAVLSSAVIDLIPPREDVVGWAATFTVTASEIEVTVTGAAVTDIDWTVSVGVKPT